MFITRVCDKCDNNTFNAVQQGTSFKLECSRCYSSRKVIKLNNQMIVPVCKKCNNTTFKFKEENEDNVSMDIICSACGAKAEYVYIDDEGNVITLEQKTILDIKKKIIKLAEKINQIETDVSDLQYKYYNINTENPELSELSYDMGSINDEINEIKADVENLREKVQSLN